MATSGKTIAKNTLFLYGRMLIVMCVSFYMSRVILSSLGATDYGVYNVVGGVVTMLAFLNGALSSSTSRFLTYELGTGNCEKLNNTFSASLNLHLCIAVLVFVLGETIGLWFFYEKLVIPEDRMMAAMCVYQFSIVTTMVNFTQVPYNAALIAHENMSIYSYVGLYEAFAKLLISYLIIISPIDKLIFYGLLILINTIGVQFFYRVYTRRKYVECRFRKIKEKDIYKILLGYSGWDLFGNLALICQNQGVNILLNIFFGPLINAARAISFQLQGAVKQFTRNFLVAVRPQVVKSFAENKYEDMYQLTFTAIRLSLLLMMMLIFPLLIETDFILSLWLGDECPPNTSLFTQIILLSAFVDTIESGQNMAFHAIGRIKKGNVICGSIMIAALPISYLFLKIGVPAVWVFWIIIICNFINVILTSLIMRGYINFSFTNMLKETYYPVTIVAFLTILGPLFIVKIMTMSWARFVLTLLIVEISVLVYGWIFAIKSSEKKLLKNYISDKFKLNENNTY